MIVNVLLVVCLIVLAFVLYKFLKLKKQVNELCIYRDITTSVLNKDVKTRKQIEKLCNEYLEHKVINSKNADNKYLEQCHKILDDIKYINLITAIDEVEIKEKEKSIIEKAIEGNIDTTDKKKGNTKKEEKQ